MTAHVIAVDPGKTGAIAALDTDGQLVTVHDMPVTGKIVSAQLLTDIIRLLAAEEHIAVAVIEDVHAMPGQGVTSMFSFGRSLGVIEGVIAAHGIPVVYVTPTRWKRDLGLTADKGAARRRACELWPDKAHLFARVKDDGRAEAALLGWWWLHYAAARTVTRREVGP